ncbi:MAG: aminotransferase DegT [Rhodobacterales bacterium]|nr:MAG: aminotransferase DegT [Rhodobacterales bacterium]
MARVPDLPPIPVSRPLTPDRDMLRELMDGIWERGWVTNNGPLVQELEGAVRADLDVPVARLVGSGTQALFLALMLGRMRGHLPPGAEVITTPLSFAASANVIEAMGLTPVFADICPDRLVLTPDAIRACLSARTGAVLNVHLFGACGDLDGMADLARGEGLWLVHDAAHAFNVTLNGRGIGRAGHVSAFSLHATKLLHTAEGGVVTSEDDALDRPIDEFRNFGLVERAPRGPGINAKMSEPHAAIGLALRARARAEAEARHRLRTRLDALVDGAPALARPALHPGQSTPLMYYPVLAPDQARRDRFLAALKDSGIGARAYFPLLCGEGRAFPAAPVPVAAQAAERLLCLPFHSDVSAAHLEHIAVLARSL